MPDEGGGQEAHLGEVRPSQERFERVLSEAEQNEETSLTLFHSLFNSSTERPRRSPRPGLRQLSPP